MKAARTTRSHVMILKADPHAIFPLLCPVREYDWIQPWRCEMVYTDSGKAELDCVFTTRFPDDGPVDMWVVSKYDPPRCIEFVRINPLRSIRYCITLTPELDGTTRAVWIQVATGLSPEGNAMVERLTDSDYQQVLAMLQKMLDHYLETGEMLKIMG